MEGKEEKLKAYKYLLEQGNNNPSAEQVATFIDEFGKAERKKPISSYEAKKAVLNKIDIYKKLGLEQKAKNLEDALSKLEESRISRVQGSRYEKIKGFALHRKDQAGNLISGRSTAYHNRDHGHRGLLYTDVAVAGLIQAQLINPRPQFEKAIEQFATARLGCSTKLHCLIEDARGCAEFAAKWRITSLADDIRSAYHLGIDTPYFIPERKSKESFKKAMEALRIAKKKYEEDIEHAKKKPWDYTLIV